MSTPPPNFNELVQACSDGDLPRVLELLPTTDPTWFKSAALRTAAQNNHTEIVLALLPHSDATAHENFALKYAIQNKNVVLFDVLFSLCTDPFHRNLYAHSVFAFIYVRWPEKMEIFKNTVIPQDQYNDVLDLFSESAGNGGPSEITELHRHLFKDLLGKTSANVQAEVMKQLLSSNLELFDILIAHNPPTNCAHVLKKCLEEDCARAITLLKRCLTANVPLPTKILSKFLEYAVDNLDWEVLRLTAIPEAWQQSKTIEQVASYNDLDLYEYCVQHGAIPTKESALISAKIGNKELTARQIAEGTTTPDVLHWICVWGWNDLLTHALNCTDKEDIRSLYSEARYGHEQSFEQGNGMWFGDCVSNNHFDCLAQVLSYVFKSTSRYDNGPYWLHQLACHFYSVPIFVDVCTKNLPTVEIDLIVKKALRSVNDSNHGWKVAEVFEVFLPFMSPQSSVKMFEKVVNMHKEDPQNHQTQKVLYAIAPYIKKKDITLSTQWWWDIHQSKKFNTKLNKKLKILGVEGAVKKM